MPNEKIYTPEIGEKIRTLRQKRGLTQKELGNLCGMADSAVRRYESGRGNPTQKTLKRIADALGVSVSYLLGQDDAISYLDKAGLSLDCLAAELDIPAEQLKRIVDDTDTNLHPLQKIEMMLTHALFSCPNQTLLEKRYRLMVAFNALSEAKKDEAIKRVEELTDTAD